MFLRYNYFYDKSSRWPPTIYRCFKVRQLNKSILFALIHVFILNQRMDKKDTNIVN